MAAYITFIVGAKGSGKSMYESRIAMELLRGYRWTEKKYPQLKKRIYFSKQKFNADIEKAELAGYSDSSGVPVPNRGHLYYWTEADQLRICPRINCWRGKEAHHLHDTDIAWDEIGNDLQPDSWRDNPVWLRQVFSHCRKRGNRIFANAQRYEMVDIHFRRQVDRALFVSKVFGTPDISPTKPPVKHPFVFQKILEFDPEQVENENDSRNLETSWLPSFKIYTGKDTKIFDTTWELPPYQPTKLKEVLLQCIEGDKCRDPKHGTKVRHILV